MKIEGILTTRSPLMIAKPNAGDVRVNLSGRYVRDGFPATEVMRLHTPALGVDSDHPALRYPIVSANTLRGGLRRAGAALVEKALIDKGQTVRMATYHALRCGTPYGHPDKANPSLDEIRLAQETPPLAVFGGGPRMIRSGLRVDTGFPLLQSLIERGIVPQKHLTSALPEGERTTVFTFLRRADDAAMFVDHDLAQHAVSDYEESMDSWQTLIGKSLESQPESADEDAPEDGAKAKKPKEDTSKLRGLAALNAFEVVVPGVPFTFRMDVETEHEASIGFAILSLVGFANAQRIGGYGRLGFGRFALDLDVTFEDGTTAKLFERRGDVYAANTAEPRIESATNAAREWLSHVSADDLDALMQPGEASRESVRKKLKGNAEAESAFDKVFGHAASK